MIQRPMVHLNGTDRVTLVRDRQKAYVTAVQLREEVRNMAPHRRDYILYDDDTALQAAYDEQTRRIDFLDRMIDDLQEEMYRILNQ